MNGENPTSPHLQYPPSSPTPSPIGSLLRTLVSQHVPPTRFDSALAVATRLLDSALKTAPSMKSADALTRSMTLRLKREGRDAHANNLATITTSLKFDRAMAPFVLFPMLYIFNDLRDTSSTITALPISNSQQNYPLSISGPHNLSNSVSGNPNNSASSPFPISKSNPQSADVLITQHISPADLFEPAPLKISVPPLQPSNSREDHEYDPRLSTSSSQRNSSSSNITPTRSPRVSPSAARSPRPSTGNSSFRRRNSKETVGHQQQQQPQPQSNHNQSLEKILVQDLMLLVQGENGAFISFTTGGRREDERVRIDLPRGMQLSLPVYDMVHCIAELGFLFRVIRAHIVPSELPLTQGLVAQNLHTAIDRELDNYYRCLVTLREPSPPNFEETLPTLRRMFVWADRERQKLRWLARLCDETRGLHGGQIIAHLRSRTGCYVSAEIRDMMRRLLRSACAPLDVMLLRWLSEGCLSADRYGEFFIMEDPKVAASVIAANPFSTSANVIEEEGLAGGPNMASAASNRIWWGLFKPRSKMIPDGGVIDEATVEKALITGKSIAFMRRCCQDTEWVDAVHAPLVQSVAKRGLGDGGTENGNRMMFEADLKYDDNVVGEVVEKACTSASKRLKDLFFERFDLSHHFGAIKKYLLLSQGDFAQALMDGLANVLDGGKEILQHNLTGYVDVALQSSSSFNEETDWDIMERLDVLTEVREGTPARSGWDVFSLTYRVEDAPLNTVFSHKVMDAYLLVFRLLWRLKRMDHLMSVAYTSLRETEKRRCQGERKIAGESTDEEEDEEDHENEEEGSDGIIEDKRARKKRKKKEVDYVLKKVHFFRMKIIHLVHNMQHYCKMEVLEGCWAVLERNMKEAENLDEMIVAHARYLTKIKDMTLQSDRSQYVAKELDAVLDIVPRFSRIQKEVCVWALSEGQDEHDMSDDGTTGEKMTEQLREIEEEFDAKFAKLLEVLSTHCQMVDACVFLLFRLDFNEYYAKREADVEEITGASSAINLSDNHLPSVLPRSSSSSSSHFSSDNHNIANRLNQNAHQQHYTLKM